MLSFNGIGTKLYGKREVNQADGSYIATKWFIFIFLPVIPLASYRVIKAKQKFLTLAYPQYQMTPVPLNFDQIRNIYLAVWGPIVLLILIGMIAG